MNIRTATLIDKPEIVKLSRSWCTSEWWEKYHKVGKKHIENQIRNKCVLILEIDNEIKGLLIYSILWNRFHIDEIVSEYLGGGKLLLDKL